MKINITIHDLNPHIFSTLGFLWKLSYVLTHKINSHFFLYSEHTFCPQRVRRAALFMASWTGIGGESCFGLKEYTADVLLPFII